MLDTSQSTFTIFCTEFDFATPFTCCSENKVSQNGHYYLYLYGTVSLLHYIDGFKFIGSAGTGLCLNTVGNWPFSLRFSCSVYKKEAFGTYFEEFYFPLLSCIRLIYRACVCLFLTYVEIKPCKQSTVT